jgi:hypothetical protein
MDLLSICRRVAFEEGYPGTPLRRWIRSSMKRGANMFGDGTGWLNPEHSNENLLESQREADSSNPIWKNGTQMTLILLFATDKQIPI